MSSIIPDDLFAIASGASAKSAKTPKAPKTTAAKTPKKTTAKTPKAVEIPVETGVSRQLATTSEAKRVIEEHLARTGMGVKKIAQISGVAPMTIHRARSGTHSPSLETIHQIVSSTHPGARVRLVVDYPEDTNGS